MMAGTRKAPAKKQTRKTTAKKSEPTLELRDDGFWWIVDGKKEINAGRNERYARAMMVG
jgi:hypothetical protein